MKKLMLSAAITAALFAGQAQALTLKGTAPNQTPDLSSTALTAQTVSEVWISGSSAATPFVEKSVLADCSGTIYKYANSTTDFTWICDSSIAAGTVNIVHKRDGGGSVTAVQSVLGVTVPTYATVASLDTATACGTPSSAGVSTCTGATIVAASHAGDINLADVDSGQFEIAANGGQVGASALANKSVATQIYGVVVNTKLRNAMQVAMLASGSLKPVAAFKADGVTPGVSGVDGCTVGDESELCMPNLTTSQISAILGNNRVTDWSNLYFGGTDNVAQSLVGVQAVGDKPANSTIHACLRTAGSGTLATFNVKYENQCFSGNEALVTSASQLIKPETSVLPGFAKIVHSMSGSGDLENCLAGLNDGATAGTFTLPVLKPVNSARWAIGIMGTDRNAPATVGAAPSKKYRFIKIDGVSPSAENVVKGKYKFWSELAHVGPQPTNTLAIDILANLGSANQITALNVTHNFGISGFLGNATNASFLPTLATSPIVGGLINGAFDPARPVNLYTHATASGLSLNHCRAPSIPTGAKAVQAFN
ncbi:MAG: hypothetical protein NTX38_01540 [Methylobacter sp.]|nr:hypothetical protein [Methylobacter sp.]